MNTTNRRTIVAGLFGLTLLVTSLVFAGQQTVSDQAAQHIWGGGCACTGSASCSSSECNSGCTSFSGGSYSVCESATSGTCVTKEVKCGTRSYCDGGEGNCDVGGSDCTCHSSNNKVTGC